MCHVAVRYGMAWHGTRIYLGTDRQRMGDRQMAYTTREAWLNKSVDLCRQYLGDCANVYVPETTKVSCGLAGGRIGAKRIGECWNPDASTAALTEIFISPVLDDVYTVLATVLHEAIHAAVGVQHGHKGPFKQAAKAAGLEGKMTATTAGAELRETFERWLQILGDYPHSALNPAARKKQTTRLVKCECQACGYIVRTTLKWIAVGAPLCPCNGQPMAYEAVTDDESENGDSE